jgi:hypothetical protein
MGITIGIFEPYGGPLGNLWFFAFDSDE